MPNRQASSRSRRVLDEDESKSNPCLLEASQMLTVPAVDHLQSCARTTLAVFRPPAGKKSIATTLKSQPMGLPAAPSEMSLMPSVSVAVVPWRALRSSISLKLTRVRVLLYPKHFELIHIVPLHSDRSLPDVSSDMRSAVMLHSKTFDPKAYLATVHPNAAFKDLSRGRENVKDALEQRSEALKVLVEAEFDRFVGVKAATEGVYQEMKQGPLASGSDYGVSSLKTTLKGKAFFLILLLVDGSCLRCCVVDVDNRGIYEG